jgi:hypothetical protein
MRKILCLALLAFALPASVATASTLPANFAGWAAIPASEMSSAVIEQFAGSQAPVLRDCGSDWAERAVYQQDNAKLTVTLYRLPDPTVAYSAYSFLRPQDVTGLKPARHSAVARTQAMLLIGNMLVEVSGQDLTRLEPALEELARQVARLASRQAYPVLWQRLPLDNIVPGSDRYVVAPAPLARALPIGSGDWLGFADGAEAELAHYRIRGRDITFVIASYPTQQLAAKRVELLVRDFNLNAKAPAADSRPVVFSRRVSSLIGLVYGTDSPAVADALLGRIAYRTEVTWNEPGFRLKELTMPQYIVGIIVGTGIILLFVFVASIAFGGFRLIVKRLWPGKVFDRRRSVEILQLGLTSKPIDARDFY